MLSRAEGRIELVTTLLAVFVLFLAHWVPAVAAGLSSLGFVLLELVSRIVDRPTWLVVLAYLVITAASLFLEFRQPHQGRVLPALWMLVCSLAVLGQLYIVALAWKLWWVLLVALGLLASPRVRALLRTRLRRDSPEQAAAAASLPLLVVSLFVVVHLLVEGAAGHILTPWLHSVSAVLSAFSAALPWAYMGLCIVLLAALLAAWWRIPLPLVRGLHPDPRKLVVALAPLSLVALSIVSGHYLWTMWNCSPSWPEGVVQLSDADGAFDLTSTADERFLVVSLREPQEILIIPLQGEGEARHLSTRTDADTAFNRSEPETLLSYGSGSEVLVLLSSSDSEQGNVVARLDAATGSIAPVRSKLGEGVSDLVRDEQGGVWLSTEMEGRVVHLDPQSLRALRQVRVLGGEQEQRGRGPGDQGDSRDRGDRGEGPDGFDDAGSGVETNKILVDSGTGRLWSVGLWTDGSVRLIDLASGEQSREQVLGTHQWDMALDRRAGRIYVPRLVEGAVHVLDANSLEQLERWQVGFGVRPIEVAQDAGLVVTGNLYRGEVSAYSSADGAQHFSHRIGGHIKGLHVSASGRIFSGSNCGVFEIRP